MSKSFYIHKKNGKKIGRIDNLLIGTPSTSILISL